MEADALLVVSVVVQAVVRLEQNLDMGVGLHQDTKGVHLLPGSQGGLLLDRQVEMAPRNKVAAVVVLCQGMEEEVQ